MGTDNDYRNFWHVACGCSPEFNMCGGWTPGLDGVDIDHDMDIEDCCPQCLSVWVNSGCPRCPCHPDNLCPDCRSFQ